MKVILCQRCKEEAPPEAVFCGSCGERLVHPVRINMGTLADPHALAKEIYDYWSESLRTDGYDDVDFWDDLDDVMRENLAEAVRRRVVEPVDQVVTELEVEISILECIQVADRESEEKGKEATKSQQPSLPQPPPVPPELCYFCSSGYVVRSHACARCLS